MFNDLGYDPESPIQDADIEMIELREAARDAEARRKAGKCDHGWTGSIRKKETPDDQRFECYECGKIFADRKARDEALGF